MQTIPHIYPSLHFLLSHTMRTKPIYLKFSLPVQGSPYFTRAGWYPISGSRHLRCKNVLLCPEKWHVCFPSLKIHWLLMTQDIFKNKNQCSMPLEGQSSRPTLQRCTVVCFLGSMVLESLKTKITLLSLTSSLLALIHWFWPNLSGCCLQVICVWNNAMFHLKTYSHSFQAIWSIHLQL